jgi:hypothetical protein
MSDPDDLLDMDDSIEHEPDTTTEHHDDVNGQTETDHNEKHHDKNDHEIRDLVLEEGGHVLGSEARYRFRNLLKTGKLQDWLASQMEKLPISIGSKQAIANHLYHYRQEIEKETGSVIEAGRKTRIKNYKQAKTLRDSLKALQTDNPEKANTPEVKEQIKLIDSWVEVLKPMESAEYVRDLPQTTKETMAKNILLLNQNQKPEIRSAAQKIAEEVGIPKEMLNDSSTSDQANKQPG